MTNVNAVTNKSNANVKIVLGDCKANIDVAAASLDLFKGDGDLDLDVDLSDDLFVQSGSGFADIDANVGNDAEIRLGVVDGKYADATSNIDIETGNNLKIYTGGTGEDNINATAKNATIRTLDGNDTIDLTVTGNYTIIAGVNESESDDDIVKIHGNLNDKTEDNKKTNYVSLGAGNDDVRIIGNDTIIEKNVKVEDETYVKDGTGDLTLGFYGDNYTVISGAENNTVGFWGDDVSINILGKGDQDIKTLNASFENNEFTDFGFEDLVKTHEKSWISTETDVESETELIDTKTEESVEITGDTTVDDLIKKYNLSSEQAEILKSVDLSATLADGSPKYSLVRVKRYGGRTDFGYFVTENYKSGNKLYGKIIDAGSKASGLGSYKNSAYTINNGTDSTGGTGTATKTTTYTTTDTYKTTTTTTENKYSNYSIDGVNNLKINFFEDGEYNVDVTVQGDGDDSTLDAVITGKNSIDQNKEQNIRVRSDYSISELISSKVSDVKTSISKEVNKKSISEQITTALGKIGLGAYTWASPLILDMNNDGEVSAASGYGVDVDNNGTADGAATNGDKMLAMSDINENGQIDGTEVFGNNTVSPFTGKALNAANGFEALKMLAIEAKQYAGIDCFEGDSVNVQKLAEALAKYNVELGFISDNNVSQLEALSGVQSINVQDYTLAASDENASIQNRQQGTFTDENGNIRKVDDVWFVQQ